MQDCPEGSSLLAARLQFPPNLRARSPSMITDEAAGAVDFYDSLRNPVSRQTPDFVSVRVLPRLYRYARLYHTPEYVPRLTPHARLCLCK